VASEPEPLEADRGDRCSRDEFADIAVGSRVAPPESGGMICLFDGEVSQPSLTSSISGFAPASLNSSLVPGSKVCMR
jgi:hypothetical protein